MKRLLLALLSLAAAQARATVSFGVTVPVAPLGILDGQVTTVVVSVANAGEDLHSVSTTVQPYGPGALGVTLETTPSPFATDILSNQTSTFTWTYRAHGCGNLVFSGNATGLDMASSVTYCAQQSSGMVTVVCTPSPTPSVTASPTVTLSPTASPVVTATPFILYATATAGPAQGDASIPGNLFHPSAGQPLQLRYYLPLDGGVSIDLYDRTGRLVHHVQRSVVAGTYTELWDGSSDNGQLVATGIYVAQFKGKGLFKTVKFAVIK
jgi:hypothetical protein